jgi:hypothetical protein
VKQLIALNINPTVLARLAYRGMAGVVIGDNAPPGWACVPDIDTAEQLPTEKFWLCGASERPMLAPGDILIDFSPDVALSASRDQTLSISLQDSPYAVDHGFLLAVGGPAKLVMAAQPLLDALAPLPAGWLHAGGLRAPAFLAALASDLGGGLTTLASMVSSLHRTGAEPLLRGQQALLKALAASANVYLLNHDDADYQPARPIPLAFGLSGDRYDVAPALQLARLLSWVAERQASGGSHS